ncbi:MAG: PEGA domain-containing protein [Kofleriaceae bacterium]
MCARRIIAVSPDPAFASRLAGLLASAGTVERVGALADVDPSTAALCVIHGPVTPTDAVRCPVIAIMSRVSLADIVALLQAWDRVVGIVILEELDELADLATRVLKTDPGPLVLGTADIHTAIVHDYDDKARCLGAVMALADVHGVARNYRAPIEQCLDEMVMNALYDAPIGPTGQPVFAGVPARIRINQRTDHAVTVQYACDGTRFAISVRDDFGALQRATVLHFLHKSLISEVGVDRRAAGAGLGLYLMVSSATRVGFHVVPGVVTIATCVFDLAAPRLQLAELELVRHDATGRTLTRPARRLASAAQRRRTLLRAIAVLGVLAVLGIGIAIVPRLLAGPPIAQLVVTTVPPGAALELDGRSVGIANGPVAVAALEVDRSYTLEARLDGHEPARRQVTLHEGDNALALKLAPLGRLQLDSSPPGATVVIDGKPYGSTPLVVTTLVPGSTVTVMFERAGHRPARARIQVPPKGELKRFVQPLEVSDQLVRVRFVSTPPGAEVVRTGQLSTTDRTYTPAELFVEAGQVQRFTLTMPKHVPLVVEPFTPARGATDLEKGGPLVPGFTLRLEAAQPGKATVSRAPHCRELALPADCTVAPGTYVIELHRPGAATVTRAVTVDADAVIRF